MNFAARVRRATCIASTNVATPELSMYGTSERSMISRFVRWRALRLD